MLCSPLLLKLFLCCKLRLVDNFMYFELGGSCWSVADVAMLYCEAEVAVFLVFLSDMSKIQLNWLSSQPKLGVICYHCQKQTST